MKFCLFAIAMLTLSGVVSAASISDFSNWTPIADPVHPGMSASVTRVNSSGGLLPPGDDPLARLSATGAIPSATDIGFASVNGDDVAGSNAGYYFATNADFRIAVDFELRPLGSMGAGAIGFGIGEDASGANSAGIGLAFVNSVPTLFAAAGRVDDVDQAVAPLVPGYSQGRLFVEYDSATGDVTVGVNPAPHSPTPLVTSTLTGIQNQWDDKPLMVSFFLRSQTLGPYAALSSGQVNAYFSNFEVLSGTPITIPEPTTSVLAILGALGVLAVSKRVGGTPCGPV